MCADWFFGKYAKNYYAKGLLPRTAAHFEKAQESGVVPEAVCMFCWHMHRHAVFEDEFHVVSVCPAYHRARLELQNTLHPDTSLSTVGDICKLLSSGDAQSMTAVGRFLIRVRQTRRKLKVRFEHLNDKLLTRSFAVRKAAWHLKKRHSCRHGVLFTQAPPDGCKCMAVTTSEADWQYMPALDEELKSIVTVAFDINTYTRLGILQANARGRGW